VKKNAERFARSDLHLSDCEKERTHYVGLRSPEHSQGSAIEVWGRRTTAVEQSAG